MAETVRIGLIGAGFVSDIHAHALTQYCKNVELVAVASRTEEKARRLAAAYGIPHAYGDYRALLERSDIDMVTVAIPNDLHCDAVCAAAEAGKHVVCEKPLARTLAEADRMIATCERHGRMLFYAEELLFAPKYVRARQLVEEGALGRPFLVKQWEEHDGPHEPWFWDVDRSGGGVVFDMGCHSIEYARWVFGKPEVRSVSATLGTFVHGEKTRGEDHSIVVVEYEGGGIGLAENSWAKGGGVDDRAEIYGTAGHTRADLLHGTALRTYSQAGYGYAVEKSGGTVGWSSTMVEEVWNYGFPQELQHFVDCVLGTATPMETGVDGREVLKIILAAYQSAGEGRKISWPYEPPACDKPIDLWHNGPEYRGR